MCLAAEEIVALGKLHRLPHEILELPPEQLRLAVTVLRAARKYRAREAGSDMQQLGEGDAFGVGRVLALIFRQLVMG